MGLIVERGHACDPPFSPEGQGMNSTNGTAIGIGEGSGEDPKYFNLKLPLLLAERPDYDLEVNKAKMTTEDCALCARIQELEAHANRNASDRTFEELAAYKEAFGIAQVHETLLDESQVNQIAAFEARNEELTVKHLASVEAAKKSVLEAQSAQAMLKNVEAELGEPRQGKLVFKASSTVPHPAPLRLVYKATPSLQVLKDENTKPRDAKRKLAANSMPLKGKIAHSIIKLDIANARFLAYSCTNMSQTYHSTNRLPT